MYDLTIKDVAKEAGVSTATVSYVLNHKDNQKITEETKAKVWRAVEKTNYLPNYALYNNKSKDTRVVGIVMDSSLRNPKNSIIVAGIVEKLEALDYRVFFCTFKKSDGQYKGWVADYYMYQMEGLIFLCDGKQCLSDMDKAFIREKNICAVVFDSLDTDDEYSTVDFDYYKDAKRLLGQVMNNSPKRMLVIAPNVISNREHFRSKAIQELKESNKNLEIILLKDDTKTMEDMKNESIHSLSLEKEFEAKLLKLTKDFKKEDVILLYWYVYQPFIQSRLEKKGIHCQYATFAQRLDIFNFSEDKLISVEIPYYQAGQSCADLVIDEIKEKKAGHEHRYHKHLILNGHVRLG